MDLEKEIEKDAEVQMQRRRKNDEVAKLLTTPLSSLAGAGKTLPAELSEAIAREQVRMQKDRRNTLRAQLAASVVGGLTIAADHEVKSVAKVAVMIADAILEEVNR